MYNNINSECVIFYLNISSFYSIVRGATRNNSNDCGAGDFPVSPLFLQFPFNLEKRDFSLGSVLLALEDGPLNVLLSHQCSTRHNQRIHRRRALIGRSSQKCRRSAISFGNNT